MRGLFFLLLIASLFSCGRSNYKATRVIDGNSFELSNGITVTLYNVKNNPGNIEELESYLRGTILLYDSNNIEISTYSSNHVIALVYNSDGECLNKLLSVNSNETNYRAPEIIETSSDADKQIAKFDHESSDAVTSYNDTELKSNTGKVIGIIDGDTYDILMEGNKKVRIRMEGIDAPEKGMPFCNKAKEYLSGLCFQKYIRLDIHKTDSNGRHIAFSYLDDGTELSHEMIKAGFAWHFKKYNSDPDLALLEIKARESRIGLWTDDSPMPPWEIRSLHRKGISTKYLFNIKEN